MKKLILLFIIISNTGLVTSPSSDTGTLILEFNNVEYMTGEIEVAIFDGRESFLQENQSIIKKRKSVEGTKSYIEFCDLPYGTYAIACYHDVNVNYQLDVSFFGFPKEPFAFSGNFSKKARKPTFQEVAVILDAPQKTISLKFMEY